MAGTEVDFKVKKGLKVEGGNIDFSNAQHATIDMDAVTTTDGAGKNISIKAGLGDGAGGGGKIVLHAGGAATSPGDGGATSHVQALTIQPGGSVHIGTNGISSTITSTGSTIDGAIIGSDSHASGKFTTLQTTGTYRADAAVVTGSTVSINNADTTSPSLNVNSDTQINGGFKGGSTTNSSLMTSELRLKSDISNDDLGGSWNGYQGDSNLLIMENAENQPAGGQGVVFSVGAGGTGSAWATGRLRGGTQTDDIFTIGHRGANWDAVGYANGTNETTVSPLQLAQSRFTINVDGDVGIRTLGGKLIFRGHASGDTNTVYEQSFRASTASTAAVSYILPTGTPGGNGYVLSSTTGGQLSWAPSASGADGMGTGFTVSATTDTTATTITQGDDLFFEASAGLTAETTADGTVTHGLDINGLTDAAVAAGDFIAFSDADTTNTRKESIDDIATFFAGAGLTATNAVIAVDADQSGQITAVGTLSSLTVGTAGGSEGAVDLNATTFDVDATGTATIDSAGFAVTSSDTTNIMLAANSGSQTALTIDAANTGAGAALISIGTTSGTAVNIGHGTSEVTFGDNVTITGNLTVNGAQTIIDSTTVVSEDKTFILGLTGGMTDATYARSGTTVTVTSSSHGFSSNEYILVQDAGNSITDDVYQITVTDVNTFTFTSPASGTVSAGATMLHSTNNTTEAIADGAGIYAPGTSLHSLQYDSSNGWTVSDDLEIATGKHISIAGDTILNNTSLGLYGNSQLNTNVLTYNTLGGTVISSSLTGVGALASGSIASGFGTISTGSAITTTDDITGDSLKSSNVTITGATIGHNTDTDLITLASGLVTVAGEISVTTLDIGGTDVTSDAGELNLLDGASAGSITNSKAVIYSSAGQVKANTVSVDAIAVIDTSTATGQSWTADSAETVASYAFGTFRTAKFVCQISNGTDFDVAEILVTYKGASAPADDAAVYLTSYAYISTAASDLGSFDAVKGTTTIDLKFTPVSTGTYSYDIVNTVLVK